MVANQQSNAGSEYDRHNAVLIDGQSLLGCRNIDWKSPIDFRILADRRDVANLIQNIVLHDDLLVDSQLLLANRECSEIRDLLGEAVKPIRLDSATRHKIINALERSEVIPEDRWLEKAVTRPELVMLITRNDYEHTEHFQTIEDRLAIRDVPADSRSDALRHEYAAVHEALQNTQKTALRAHYYLELSRHLGLYYSPHPSRAAYFRELLEKKRSTGEVAESFSSVAVEAVQLMDKAQRAAHDKYSLSYVNFTIPPVAEYVAKLSVQKNATLVDAVFEVRESDRAKEFRKWSGERNRVIAGGRSGLREQKSVLTKLETTCQAWASDLAEGVTHRKRKITWGELPWLGSVIKTLEIDKLLGLVGWETKEVKDPVLWVDQPYLVFLNDLYQ
jgi:hypothetical protein